jgi:hypothetical protein
LVRSRDAEGRGEAGEGVQGCSQAGEDGQAVAVAHGGGEVEKAGFGAGEAEGPREPLRGGRVGQSLSPDGRRIRPDSGRTVGVGTLARQAGAGEGGGGGVEQVRSGAGGQEGLGLVPASFGSRRVEIRAGAGSQACRIQAGVAQARGDAEEAQRAERILSETGARIPDETHTAPGEVFDAADVVMDPSVGVEEQGVDGEIPPGRVLRPSGAEARGGGAEGAGSVGAQGGHLDRRAVGEHDRDGPVLQARRDGAQARGRGAGEHVLWHGRGGDVDVLRRPSQQEVAHRAAGDACALRCKVASRLPAKTQEQVAAPAPPVRQSAGRDSQRRARSRAWGHADSDAPPGKGADDAGAAAEGPWAQRPVDDEVCSLPIQPFGQDDGEAVERAARLDHGVGRQPWRDAQAQMRAGHAPPFARRTGKGEGQEAEPAPAAAAAGGAGRLGLGGDRAAFEQVFGSDAQHRSRNGSGPDGRWGGRG